MRTRFLVFTGINDQFYFSLCEVSGRIIIRGTGHRTKKACMDAVNAVRLSCADESRYERWTIYDERYCFVIRSFDNEIIAKSESYRTISAREMAIEIAKREGPCAPLEDVCGIQ